MITFGRVIDLNLKFNYLTTRLDSDKRKQRAFETNS